MFNFNSVHDNFCTLDGVLIIIGIRKRTKKGIQPLIEKSTKEIKNLIHYDPCLTGTTSIPVQPPLPDTVQALHRPIPEPIRLRSMGNDAI